MTKKLVAIAIDVPLFKTFDYVWDIDCLNQLPCAGQLVEVEFGKKHTVGVVVEVTDYPAEAPAWEIKPVLNIAPIKPLESPLLKLCKFASKYYLKPLGEVILSAIPKEWKLPSKWKTLEKNYLKAPKLKTIDNKNFGYALNAAQQTAVERLKEISKKKAFEAVLLKGITGSGKTAVYLEWIASVLDDEQAQCLLLVPEINLTPQLEEELIAKFPHKEVAVLHSEVTSAKRASAWARAHLGFAKLIVGTRLSVMASLPNLKAIVVDEEHDGSYKQQEGIRYSARDLAIWRAADQKIPVVLTSATPSCETWQKALEQKLTVLRLEQRAKPGAKEPRIVLVNMKEAKRRQQIDEYGLSDEVKSAIQKTLDRNLQTLVFINRRGYSPVLTCKSCGWKSNCPKCSSYLVLHKKDTLNAKSMLHCHHCGLVSWIPKHCPECGNQDIDVLGSGTQRIEDRLSELFPSQKIIRIDTDATRKKGSAKELFDQVHSGEAHIVVGTQMLSKGHDFDGVDTVVVLDADKSLYSQDFRSTEKLFAQLVQVSGRSGRSHKAVNPQILIQTEMPEHELFQALMVTNIDSYLTEIAKSRELAQLPPYSNQAILIGEARQAKHVMEALLDIKRDAQQHPNWPKNVTIYDVVPRLMAKVAGKERMQLLLESVSRSELQTALEIILDFVELTKKKSRSVRITIERDPVTF